MPELKKAESPRATTVFRMKVFAAGSHPGLKRDHNEDYYRADADQGLWLVADGVGGHADGEVAAQIVGDTVVQTLAEGACLTEGIMAAHRAVLREIQSRENSNMGSTVVALSLQDDAYEICWVGDSRAYVYDGELRQLSRDHNPVKELLARGAITPEQAAVHPERHVLSQSLGVSGAIRVDPGRIRGRLLPGQQLLLCSDGLTDEIDDAKIAATLAAQSSSQDQVDALIEAALEAGGSDNITAIVIGAPVERDVRRQQYADNMATRELAVTPQDDFPEFSSRDKKVWLLLSMMGALAVLWVLLRIF